MGFCRPVVHAESGCDSGVKGLPAATRPIGSLFNGGLIHTLATQSVTKVQDVILSDGQRKIRLLRLR